MKIVKTAIVQYIRLHKQPFTETPRDKDAFPGATRNYFPETDRPATPLSISDAGRLGLIPTCRHNSREGLFFSAHYIPKMSRRCNLIINKTGH